MDQPGNVGAPPPEPPPRPSLLPKDPSEDGLLVLRVSHRILWVGSAAIPLHNITWVEAFMLKPKGSVPPKGLSQWLMVVLLVFFATGFLEEDGAHQLVSFLVVIVVIALLKEVFASAKPALVVEMASGSEVTVTLPSIDELRRLAERIVRAIDHPETEFTTVVKMFNSSNTNNYGPVVNIRGGRGNTGISL